MQAIFLNLFYFNINFLNTYFLLCQIYLPSTQANVECLAFLLFPLHFDVFEFWQNFVEIFRKSICVPCPVLKFAQFCSSNFAYISFIYIFYLQFFGLLSDLGHHSPISPHCVLSFAEKIAFAKIYRIHIKVCNISI